ncbi:MAG: IS200/IS605 family transposase [Flavobacteriales bacterium]
MANTYTQLHIQVVFAVQFRQNLISETWEDELYKYMTTIIQNNGHKVLKINGMPDHIHILFGLRPSQSLSDLMKQVKQDSTNWINKKGFVKGRFSWQSGYGAFSYCKSVVPKVIRYIENQKPHHEKKAFLKEYVEMLESVGIEYNKQYLFKQI